MMKNGSNKVLLLNYEFPPLGGGGGVASFSLARGYAACGYSVDCVTSRFAQFGSRAVMGNINVYRVRVFGRRNQFVASMISLFSYPFSAFFCSCRLLFRNRYSFINAHFAIPTGLVGALLSRLFRVQLFLSVHGKDIYDPTTRFSPHRFFLLRWVVRRVLCMADVVVAQSEDIRRRVHKYYSPDVRVHVIPLSYEPVVFTPCSRISLGLQEHCQYIVTVGRLVPRKGFSFLIRALASLSHSDAQLVIVGDGPERVSLESIARGCGVYDRVIFAGSVSQERKMQYLHCADVFVLSSLHEGFGIVLFEAMQVGLPIVATKCGGPVDLLSGLEGAAFVPSKEVLPLSRAIDKKLRFPERPSFSDALARYRPEIIARRYLSLV